MLPDTFFRTNRPARLHGMACMHHHEKMSEITEDLKGPCTNSWSLRALLLGIVVQVLGKYMIIMYSDP